MASKGRPFWATPSQQRAKFKEELGPINLPKRTLNELLYFPFRLGVKNERIAINCKRISQQKA